MLNAVNGYRYQLYGNILTKLVSGDHASTSLLKVWDYLEQDFSVELFFFCSKSDLLLRCRLQHGASNWAILDSILPKKMMTLMKPLKPCHLLFTKF